MTATARDSLTSIRRRLVRPWWREEIAFAVATVAMIVTSVVAVASVWFGLDTLPPFTGLDPVDHLMDGVRLDLLLTSGRDIVHKIGAIPFLPTHYPPLYGGIEALTVALLGIPRSISQLHSLAALMGTLFVTVLTGSTYYIAARVGGRWAGVLAAILIAFSPLVFSQTRYFMIDMPLAAVTALTFAALLASPDFDDIRGSAFVGACLAAGLLMKWTYPLFVAVPVVVAAGMALRAGRWRNVLVCAAVATVGAGWWYAPNIVSRNLLGWLVWNAGFSGFHGMQLACSEGTLSICRLTFYLRGLNASMSFAYMALFAAAAVLLIVLAIRGRLAVRPGLRRIVVALVLGDLLLTAASSNTEPRYGLPLLPLVAAIGGIGLAQLPRRRLVAGAVGLLGLVQMIAISLGISALPAGAFETQEGPPDQLFSANWFPNPFFQQYADGPQPVVEDWRTGDIVAAVEAVADIRADAIAILTPRGENVYAAVLYQLWLDYPGTRFDKIGQNPADTVDDYRLILVHDDADKPFLPVDWVSSADALQVRLDSQAARGVFRVGPRIDLPRGSSVTLYVRVQ